MKLNMLEDLLTSSEVSHYFDLPYPSNVKFLSEKLNAKLKINPDYEVFVPVIYIRLMTHTQINLNDYVFKAEGWWVSNKGRIFSTNRAKKGKIIRTYLNNDGYLEARYIKGSKQITLPAHRIVASTFITPQFNIIPQYSIVRFKDDNKENVHSSNLYWDGFENYH